MNTPAWVWAATLIGVAVLLAIDLFVIGRRPHEPSTKEATWWVVFYISLAVAFGAGVWIFAGHQYGGEFFSGYITEYSMSVDNLFVFMLIMSIFSVPRQFQQKALMVGIITALVLRGIFIAIGAELVERFVWVFFIFGAFLIFTAIQLLRNGNEDEEFNENIIIRVSRRLMPVTQDYHGGKIFVKVDGRRMVTPLLIVMIALGTTDLLFAVDSIPATFGLTQVGFLVFSVNVFALMGLRQLYFLLGGLLQRLVYLSYGLAAILGFIGVKLVLHALAENDLPFINNGEHIEGVPDINTWVSLGAIVVILVVATAASLLFPPRGVGGSSASSPTDTEDGEAEVGRGDDTDQADQGKAESTGTPHAGGSTGNPATVHHK